MRSRISSSAMPSSFAHSATGRSRPKSRTHSSWSSAVSHWSASAFSGDRAPDHAFDDFLAHVGDRADDFGRRHHFLALLDRRPCADRSSRRRSFSKMLADFVVARLDLLLRLFERLVDPGMDDGLAFLADRDAAACRPCARSRRCASDRLRARRRISTRRDRPGGPSGRATDCRCVGSRAARCR